MSEREQRKNDEKFRAEFAKELLLELKLDNIFEGMNLFQAFHFHSRLRAWTVNVPNVPELGPYAGTSYVLDLLNLSLTGDIETACKALEWGTPDDMSLPYHWLTQDRLTLLVGKLKTFLGWP